MKPKAVLRRPADIIKAVQVFKIFGKKLHLSINLILIIILATGLFSRVYKFESLYTFDHDQDLSAWIVKDILINHHLRLIGQLTSIDGIFVGPLYYYLLAVFFAIFKMNPLAAHIPATLIGLATIASIYFVISKFFTKAAGLIGAFIYTTAISLVFLDRWIVPTMPTVLWSVWLLFVLLSLLKGNYKILPVAGILIGLIWHIHIALFPLLLLIPTAVFLSGKKVHLKQLFVPVLLVLILMLPFIAFESRHGAQQIKGLINSASYTREDEPQGFLRLKMVLAGSSSAFSRVVFRRAQIPPLITFIFFISLALYLKKRTVLSKNQLILIGLWFLANILSQQLSKRDISEYYFNNLIILSILILSLAASTLIQGGGAKRIATFFLMIIFLVQNILTLLSTKSALDGYEQKKKIIENIQNDVLKNNYPCIGINYIASFGKRVGFRYLSWKYGLNVVQGSTSIPVYNVVIPPASLPNEMDIGGIGLILPKVNSPADKSKCQDPNNQLQPLLNFTS